VRASKGLFSAGNWYFGCPEISAVGESNRFIYGRSLYALIGHIHDLAKPLRWNRPNSRKMGVKTPGPGRPRWLSFVWYHP